MAECCAPDSGNSEIFGLFRAGNSNSSVPLMAMSVAMMARGEVDELV
jgi:hypothetical protein